MLAPFRRSVLNPLLVVSAVVGGLLVHAAQTAPGAAAAGPEVRAATVAASTGDVGALGPSTAGAGKGATAEKPESKLWWDAGSWWAVMWDSSTSAWRIARHDRSTTPATWIFTAVVVDTRPDSRADVLWDAGKVYIASHVRAASSDATVSGQPAYLKRFTWDPAASTYVIDPGFPVAVNDVSSETLVMDRDTNGRLWVTWTQGAKVYVNASVTPGDDLTWGAPFVLPAQGSSGLDADDISTVVAYRGQVGVLWSSQTSSEVRFAAHAANDPVDQWGASVVVTIPGLGQADDHLNIKSLQSDDSGRLYAVIKTSLDNEGPSAPQIVVLARSSTGEWTRATFGTVSDCHTRPQLVLDETNNLVHVYATAPESGCAYSGSSGSIFTKTSPMSGLSFAPGRGTPVMQSSFATNLNNVTGTKQTVTAATGLVLLATDDVKQVYWSSDQQLGATPPPPPAPQKVVLAPAADSWVDSKRQSSNFGSSVTLYADGSPLAASYLKFDVGSLGGRTVESAVLRLRVSTGGSSDSQRIRLVTNDAWTERGLTWSNRPAVGGAVGTLGPTSKQRTYDVALSATTIQGQLGGLLSLAVDSTVSDAVDLASRETSTPATLILTLS